MVDGALMCPWPSARLKRLPMPQNSPRRKSAPWRPCKLPGASSRNPSGARLDPAPEMLFTLRHVDHLELISQAAEAESLDRRLSGSAGTLAGADLGEVFGIDLDTVSAARPANAKQEQPALAEAPPENPA